MRRDREAPSPQTPHAPQDAGRPTFGSGMFLFAVLLVLGGVIGALPWSEIAIDLAGAQGQGRVVEHRNSCIGGGHTGMRCFKSAIYVFRTADGERIEGDAAFEADPLPKVGTAVEVRYLAAWPKLSHYGEGHYTSFVFWLLFVGSLVMAGMCLSLLRKIAALLKEP